MEAYLVAIKHCDSFSSGNNFIFITEWKVNYLTFFFITSKSLSKQLNNNNCDVKSQLHSTCCLFDSGEVHSLIGSSFGHSSIDKRSSRKYFITSRLCWWRKSILQQKKFCVYSRYPKIFNTDKQSIQAYTSICIYIFIYPLYIYYIIYIYISIYKYYI